MIRTIQISLVFLVLLSGPVLLRGQGEAPPAVLPPHRILLQLDQLDAHQMSSAHRQVVATRQAQLNGASGSSGYDLQQGDWIYQQAVCPLFPQTILLRYESGEGTANTSQFVVVVPRDAGDVQIIPTLRRGNAPFRPSYKNGTTIGAFNNLLEREN